MMAQAPKDATVYAFSVCVRLAQTVEFVGEEDLKC